MSLPHTWSASVTWTEQDLLRHHQQCCWAHWLWIGKHAFEVPKLMFDLYVPDLPYFDSVGVVCRLDSRFLFAPWTLQFLWRVSTLWTLGFVDSASLCLCLFLIPSFIQQWPVCLSGVLRGDGTLDRQNHFWASLTL